MTEQRLVVDLSSNDIGKTDVAELIAHGVAAAILSPFSRGNPPQDMAGLADLCRRGGLPILAWYGLPYFGDAGAEERDLRWCVELAREYVPLNNTIFADCENDAREVGWDNAPVPTADQRVEALWRVKRDVVEAAGRRFGVYAGTFWWRDHMGNTRAFEDCPWWLPAYGPGGNPCAAITAETVDGDHILSFRPKLVGHQFTSLWGQQPPFSAEHPCAGRAARDMSFWYEPFGAGAQETAQKPADRPSELEDLILSVWGAAGDAGDRKARLESARYRMTNAVNGHDEAGNPVEPVAGRLATLALKVRELARRGGTNQPADFDAIARELQDLADAFRRGKP